MSQSSTESSQKQSSIRPDSAPLRAQDSDSDSEWAMPPDTRGRPKSAMPHRMVPPVQSTPLSHTDEEPPVTLFSLLKEHLPPPTKATAHKRYMSVYPCSSKLLAKKWDDAARQRHLSKLKTMKACIDNVQSSTATHLSLPSKKILNEQGNASIQSS